jgi:hypothetical protein
LVGLRSIISFFVYDKSHSIGFKNKLLYYVFKIRGFFLKHRFMKNSTTNTDLVVQNLKLTLYPAKEDIFKKGHKAVHLDSEGNKVIAKNINPVALDIPGEELEEGREDRIAEEDDSIYGDNHNDMEES